MPKQPSEPQIQAHNFEEFDELAENVQGWEGYLGGREKIDLIKTARSQ